MHGCVGEAMLAFFFRGKKKMIFWFYLLEYLLPMSRKKMGK